MPRLPSTVLLALSLIGAAAAASCHPSGAPTPASSAEPAPAPPAPANAVDAALQTEWTRLGVEPAGPADEAELLRRLSIDLVGTIPAPEEVTAFLADRDPNKIAKTVDRLLDDPRHARFEARRWERILLGDEVRTATLDRGALNRWLELQFDDNRPWDELVHDLVAATGVNSTGGGRQDEARFGGIDRAKEERAEGVNGAVNWLIRYAQRPEDLAGATASSFLGLQIQCAQCHDHKTEPWTQDDFRSFTAAFARTRGTVLGGGERGEIRRIEVIDDDRAPRRWRRDPELAPIVDIAPRAIDGTPLPEGPERRRALAAWIVSADNPTFAKAIVNRTWADLMGSGFVEPVDDMRPSNPARMPALLDALARDFVAHDYDLRHLVRSIATSEAYRRSARGGGNPAAGETAWSRYPPSPMSPEVLLDSVIDATGVMPVLARVGRGDAEQIRFKMARQLRFIFPEDAESNGPTFEGTIQQALLLLNGNAVATGTSQVPGAALDALLATDMTDDDRVRTLFLRTVSRPPTPEETASVLARIAAVPPADVADGDPPAGRRGAGMFGRKQLTSQARSPREQAFEDVFWALLNSTEFASQH